MYGGKLVLSRLGRMRQLTYLLQQGVYSRVSPGRIALVSQVGVCAASMVVPEQRANPAETVLPSLSTQEQSRRRVRFGFGPMAGQAAPGAAAEMDNLAEGRVVAIFQNPTRTAERGGLVER